LLKAKLPLAVTFQAVNGAEMRVRPSPNNATDEKDDTRVRVRVGVNPAESKVQHE